MLEVGSPLCVVHLPCMKRASDAPARLVSTRRDLSLPMYAALSALQCEGP